MSSRSVEQPRRETFNRSQIANPKCNWARRQSERVTLRDRMIDCSSIIDTALRGADCLTGEPLNPLDPSEADARLHPLVAAKANDVRPNRGDIPAEHALDMASRAGLIPE